MNVYETEVWNRAIEAAADSIDTNVHAIDLPYEIRKLKKCGQEKIKVSVMGDCGLIHADLDEWRNCICCLRKKDKII